MTLSRDFYDNGVDSGHLAMRVLSGEDPARIPFQPVLKTWFTLNLSTAAQYGIAIPESMVKSADEVIR
jgi:putative ABC transport system substrate-binding protein